MEENGVSKYYLLMEQIKGEILSGKILPGQKLLSENQYAERYSMSRLQSGRRWGFWSSRDISKPFTGKAPTARTDAPQKNFPEHRRGDDLHIGLYLSQLIQGMDRVLGENGYSIILKNTGNSRQREARCLEELLKKDIDGLIIEPSKSELSCKHVSLYQALDRYEIPYVFIQGLYAEMQDKPHILMDDAMGGYLAASYLLKLGHKRIAGFFKADDMQGIERHKGYVKALQEAGRPYDPEDVVWYHTEDRKMKPAIMLRLMEKDGRLPDGIVCYNDQIAAMLMEELGRLGYKVPEDVSVTGFDDSLFAQRGGGITTVAHPQEKLGEMAAELLLEKINGVPKEKSRIPELIQPQLIIRGSCRDRKDPEKRTAAAAASKS